MPRLTATFIPSSIFLSTLCIAAEAVFFLEPQARRPNALGAQSETAGLAKRPPRLAPRSEKHTPCHNPRRGRYWVGCDARLTTDKTRQHRLPFSIRVCQVQYMM